MEIFNVQVKYIISFSLGIGYSSVEEFLSGLNVPVLQAKRFTKEQQKLLPDVMLAAEASMRAAAEEEKAWALENGNVAPDGTPMCEVVADGAWSKRSFKTKYNALSGCVSKLLHAQLSVLNDLIKI